MMTPAAGEARRRTLPRWRVVLTLAAPTEEDVIRALRSLLRQIGRAWGLRCRHVELHVEPDHGAEEEEASDHE